MWSHGVFHMVAFNVLAQIVPLDHNFFIRMFFLKSVIILKLLSLKS